MGESTTTERATNASLQEQPEWNRERLGNGLERRAPRGEGDGARNKGRKSNNNNSDSRLEMREEKNADKKSQFNGSINELKIRNERALCSDFASRDFAVVLPLAAYFLLRDLITSTRVNAKMFHMMNPVRPKLRFRSEIK